MSILDKVKGYADKAADAAAKATAVGKDKIDDARAQKKLNDLYAEIGRARRRPAPGRAGRRGGDRGSRRPDLRDRARARSRRRLAHEPQRRRLRGECLRATPFTAGPRNSDAALAGRELRRVEIRRDPRGVRPPPPGTRVTEVVARGKHLLVRFDDGATLHTHMQLHGIWHVYRPHARWRRPAHTARVVLEVDDGTTAVCFNAPVVELRRDAARPGTSRALRSLEQLGPDLCGAEADLDRVLERLHDVPADAPIGDVLLDQRVAAGIGNVFKSEICWARRVSTRRHPSARCRKPSGGTSTKPRTHSCTRISAAGDASRTREAWRCTGRCAGPVRAAARRSCARGTATTPASRTGVRAASRSRCSIRLSGSWSSQCDLGVDRGQDVAIAAQFLGAVQRDVGPTQGRQRVDRRARAPRPRTRTS